MQLQYCQELSTKKKNIYYSIINIPFQVIMGFVLLQFIEPVLQLTDKIQLCRRIQIMVSFECMHARPERECLRSQITPLE